MEKFLIGKIVKAQGIKGEVKIKSRCGDLAFLGKQKYLMIKGQNVAVKSMRTGGEFAYVLFSTIADRNMAEALIGQDVYADRHNITLDDDSYFTSDMMGSRVVLNDGSEVGVVSDILQNGRPADVYYVATADGTAVFPFLKDLVVSFDPEEKVLTLYAKRFAEVSFHED